MREVRVCEDAHFHFIDASVNYVFVDCIVDDACRSE